MRARRLREQREAERLGRYYPHQPGARAGAILDIGESVAASFSWVPSIVAIIGIYLWAITWRLAVVAIGTVALNEAVGQPAGFLVAFGLLIVVLWLSW